MYIKNESSRPFDINGVCKFALNFEYLYSLREKFQQLQKYTIK